MVGQTIGKYRIVQRLGRGGMGTVYKAVDETLERDVAIKILNPGLGDTELLKRFRAEALALARLNHPNIATVYELTRYDDELLMVMEFVRGEALDKLSDRTGPMPFERAASLCGQVLTALGHAHAAGIVHRDLKPANMMLTEDGVVKVMDFGIARMIGTEHLTTDGFMMGTPAYMAPEQVMGHDVDGRADLYSVGVVLYRLLTSNLPFKADTPIAMVQKQVKDPPTPLRQFRAELPAWCQQILDRALAKAPGERFQTAEEFRIALTRSAALAPPSEVTSILAAAPAAASTPEVLEPTLIAPAPTPVPPAAPAPKQTKPPAVAVPAARRPSSALPLAVAALLLVALGAAALVMWRRSQPPGTPETGSVAPVTSTVAPIPVTTPPAAVSTEAPPSPAATEPTTSAAALAAPDARGGRPGGSRRRAAAATTTVPPPAPPTDPPEPAPPPEPPPPAKPTFPALVFTPVRTVVFAGDNAREREVRLTLGETAVIVSPTGGSGPDVKSLPYDLVTAIYQSRSREPQWVTPAGAVSPVIRVDRGAFGFLKGDRDWLTIRTKDEFVSLRSDGDILKRVAAALEERTGLTVVRAERSRR